MGVFVQKYEPTMRRYYPRNNSYIPYGADVAARRLNVFDTTQATDTRSQVHLLMLKKLCLVFLFLRNYYPPPPIFKSIEP